MPYVLHKAPRKDMYWVVNKESGKKYSKKPLPKGRAEAQMRVLQEAEGLVGGVTARDKADAIAKLSKIRTSVELNAERSITPLERAIWWYLHPDQPDTRHGKIRDNSFKQALAFLEAEEEEEEIPEAPARPPAPAPPAPAPAPAPPRERPVSAAVPDYFEISYLKVKNSIPPAEQRRIRLTGTVDLSKILGDTPVGGVSSDSAEYREKMAKDLSQFIMNPIAQHSFIALIKLKDGLTDATKGERTTRLNTTDDMKKFFVTYPRSGGMRGGGSTPTKNILQQMAVAAYDSTPPQNLGEFKLVRQSPTLKFYYDDKKNFMIVAIRGTKITDKHDLIADALAVTGRLRNSYRYNNDLQQIKEVKKLYPKTRFFGIGHSLGGAILDLLLRSRLLIGGMSYNGFPEPHERGGNPIHHRIYHTGDFIYKLFAKNIPNIELRTTSEPFWKYLIQYSMPVDIFTGIDRHLLDRFKGGSF